LNRNVFIKLLGLGSL